MNSHFSNFEVLYVFFFENLVLRRARQPRGGPVREVDPITFEIFPDLDLEKQRSEGPVMSGGAAMDVVIEDVEEGAPDDDPETEVVSPPPLRLSWQPFSPVLPMLT